MGPLVAGAKLGRYEILAKLAAGGMAIVYVGRVQGVAGFERLVAIKVLHANLAHEEEFIGMFLDEARLAASIRHPNVVPTIDISDSEEAGYFIVMEYIEGDHLGALLSSAHKLQEKLPLPIALRIVADALGGLGAAHDLCDETGKSLQLVHRDVSPHNIMVGRDGVVRLTDFGVAKAEDRLTHTRDGQVKGKLAYMAPEQAANGQTDSRSDLFSMGVILWECLTGERLFRAENTAATLHKLLHAEIPAPSSLDPHLAPLDGLLAKALSRDLSLRYQTAEEFAQAIEEVAPTLGGLSSLRGVARVVKQYAAAKLKRDKKLIDDALRVLRPAGVPDLTPELEAETTSPSVTDLSLPGESLSASKVSGVFSHDTLPGTRRLNVRRKDESWNSVMRPLPPGMTATQPLPPGMAATQPLRAGTAATQPLRAGTANERAFDPILDAPPAAGTLAPAFERPHTRRGVRLTLWLVAGVALGAALWALRAPGENVRAHKMSTLAVPQAAAVESLAPSEPVTSEVQPAVPVIAPVPDTSYFHPPVVPPGERTLRRPASKDDPPSEKVGRRARRDKERVGDPAVRTVPREKPRAAATPAAAETDVMPNPYHN
jgi:serine/threonine-protein kinase